MSLYNDLHALEECEDLERDGAACREVMRKPNVELLERDLEHAKKALQSTKQQIEWMNRDMGKLEIELRAREKMCRELVEFIAERTWER